ncbi:AraC family transcriptional regulator [Burkholderia sp. DN3021]|uniref:AraC family transcriptional regulator n=1 Tax=Burkholderia sp. DN3021 TaxID=3410137 RepID=UPI003C7D13A4
MSTCLVAAVDPELQGKLVDSERSLLHVNPAAAGVVSAWRAPPAMLDDWRVLAAVRFMEQRLDGQMRLDDIAAQADLSPHHFQRYFKKLLGQSPAAYRRRIQLERAALHLWITGHPVIDIAFMAGYASHEAFVRAFYAQFGRVPSEYRSHARQQVSFPTAEERGRVAEIRVCEQQQVPLLAMRFYGPYASVETHWQRFVEHLQVLGIAPERFQAIGIAYDSPEIVHNAFIRYDCAIVTSDYDHRRSGLARLPFRAGAYGVLSHDAPYDQIFSTYRILSTAWLPTMADELRMELTCAYECYREPPWLNVGGSQRFDLMLPVAWLRAPSRPTGARARTGNVV